MSTNQDSSGYTNLFSSESFKETSQAYISKELDAKRDTMSKIILSKKMVLAYILKTVVPEYADLEPRDIAVSYIEKHIKRDCDPEYDSIIGNNPNAESSTDGNIEYDIYFYASLPNSKDSIEIVCNVESQQDFNPKYSLVKRGLYYCARLISSQKTTLFQKSEYDNIKKVYSIWICTSPTVDAVNTITNYSINENHIVGNYSNKMSDYDLVNLVFINLDPKNDNIEHPLIRKLTKVLCFKGTKDKLNANLNDEFQCKFTPEEQKEASVMETYSQQVYNEGEIKGKIEQAIEMCKEFGKSPEEAMKYLLKKFNLSKEEAIQKVKEYWK